MTGWAWVGLIGGLLLIAVLIGVVVLVGRQSEERRGGMLEFDTPGARAPFGVDPDDWFAFTDLKRERANVGYPIITMPGSEPRTWSPEDGWPLPVIVDPTVAQGTVEVRTTALRRCKPSRGVHYHGSGERCECGAKPNIYGVSTRLREVGIAPPPRVPPGMELLRHPSGEIEYRTIRGDDAA